MKQAQQQIVPILEQDYSVSIETSISKVKIEKRLVTKTKTVKVPVVYEELYINDKKLKSVEESQVFSALKDKISSIASRGNTSVGQSIDEKKKIENMGELVPCYLLLTMIIQKPKEKKKELFRFTRSSWRLIRRWSK